MAQRIKRDLVRTLLETNKLSPKEISEEASVSLATVYNVKNKLKAGDSLEHAKGGGRPGDKQHHIALLLNTSNKMMLDLFAKLPLK